MQVETVHLILIWTCVQHTRSSPLCVDCVVYLASLHYYVQGWEFLSCYRCRQASTHTFMGKTPQTIIQISGVCHVAGGAILVGALPIIAWPHLFKSVSKAVCGDAPHHPPQQTRWDTKGFPSVRTSAACYPTRQWIQLSLHRLSVVLAAVMDDFPWL